MLRLGHESYYEVPANEFQETTEGVVRLPEDDPAAVYRMLEFLYTGDYDAKDEGYISPRPQYPEETPETMNMYTTIQKPADTELQERGLSSVATARSENTAIKVNVKPPPGTPQSDILNHTKVLELARKYTIDPLIEAIKERLKSCIPRATEPEIIEATIKSKAFHRDGDSFLQSEFWQETLQRLWWDHMIDISGMAGYGDFCNLVDKSKFVAGQFWPLVEEICRLRSRSLEHAKFILSLPKETPGWKEVVACRDCMYQPGQTWDACEGRFYCEDCVDPYEYIRKKPREPRYVVY